MKISVFYDHILQAAQQSGKPIEKLLQGVYEAGIEAVEIRLEYLLEHEKTLKLLRDTGLGISCIYEFYEMENKSETDKIKKHVETAAKLNAKKLLVVPGFLSEAEADEMWKLVHDYEKLSNFFNHNDKVVNMAKGLSECVKAGSDLKVTITVEDFDDIKSPLSNMYGIKWFLEKVPGLRYTLDMGNFIFHEEDVMAAWELLKDKVAHVHCKDRGEGFSSVAAGAGNIPIAELVMKLKESGYDDYLAVEHFDTPNQEQCMKSSAEFLQKLIMANDSLEII
ncbi:MAG: sugar phosphate isomerase/epimerase [Clostridiales bacterium]|nr:sugar phosphate isomerase/epimerase [Clostridiales bacterium]